MELRHGYPWRALVLQPFSVWIVGVRQGYRRLGSRPLKQAGLYFAEGLAKGRYVQCSCTPGSRPGVWTIGFFADGLK